MREARFARAAVYWGCRAVHLLRSTAGRAEHVVEGFARTALSVEEMRAVTARIYDWQPHRQRQLFAWEERWWTATLPSPPANILIGGCGRGREVAALINKGYEVWAFDPSMDSIRECQLHNPRAAYVGCFGYEDLVQSKQAVKAPNAQLIPAGTTFSAVIMGWGSLSHIIDEQAQESVLAELASLAPDGPILTSFLSRMHVQPEGRAEKLGAVFGQRFARLRGKQRIPSIDRAHVRCLAHGGFVYGFTAARMQTLADACERRLELHLGTDYPHATFWPAPHDDAHSSTE